MWPLGKKHQPGFPQPFSFAEFTPKDVVQLQMYDTQWTQPAACAAAAGQGYCQIMGRLEVPLRGFNSILPYAHMNERCQALPLAYTRTPTHC